MNWQITHAKAALCRGRKFPSSGKTRLEITETWTCCFLLHILYFVNIQLNYNGGWLLSSLMIRGNLDFDEIFFSTTKVISYKERNIEDLTTVSKVSCKQKTEKEMCQWILRNNTLAISYGDSSGCFRCFISLLYREALEQLICMFTRRNVQYAPVVNRWPKPIIHYNSKWSASHELRSATFWNLASGINDFE